MATHHGPQKKMKSAMSSGIQLDLKDHGEPMLLSISEMFSGNEFCDVTLDVGGRLFRCHKAVLGAASSYFKSMFSNGMAESKQDTITLQETDPDVFSKLLNFIYTGKFIVDSEDELENLVRGAIFFDVYCLQEACISFMVTELVIYSHSDWFLYRRLYNELGRLGHEGNKDFSTVLFEYAVDFFQILCIQPDFVHLDVGTLIRIVSSDKLLVKHENIVFDAVKIWLASNRDASSGDVITLLEQVRYPLMEAAYVHNVVGKYSDEENLPRLRELVNEATMCHLLPEKKLELVGKSKRGTKRTPASADERDERSDNLYGFKSCLNEGDRGIDQYSYIGYGQEILSKHLGGLLAEDILCDLQVNVQKEHFRCHKVVLAAFSNYFKEQIISATKKTPRSRTCALVTVKDIDPNAFRMLLDFAYSGSLQVSKGSFRNISQAGKILDSLYVKKACCCLLDKDINAENCLDIVLAYQELGYLDLAIKPLGFAAEQFENIMTHPQFCRLDVNSLGKIVSDYSMTIRKEEVLFEALKLWYPSARTPTPEFTLSFEKICKKIRFPLMPAAYLCTEVQAFCEKINSPVLWDLLEEAKLCHLMPEKRNELIGKLYYSHRVTPRNNYVGFSNYTQCDMHQVEARFIFNLQNASKLDDTFQESPVCEIGNYFWSLKVRVEGGSPNSPGLAAYVLFRPKVPGQKEFRNMCMTSITVELVNHKDKAGNVVKELPKARRKANTLLGWPRFYSFKGALNSKAGYRIETRDKLRFKVGVVVNVNTALLRRKVVMDLDPETDSD